MKIKFLLFLMFITTNLFAVRNVQIITKTLPNGQNAVAYSTTVKAKFGTKPYTWTKSGTLPTGLSLAASTGIISGTPIVNGTSTFTIICTDSAGSPTVSNRSFSITITGGAVITPVTISTVSIPSGTVGSAYSVTFAATGGTSPYTWSKLSGTFPAGITLTTDTLSGTPTASGSYAFTIRVTDAAAQIYDRAFVLTVANSGVYLFTDDFESGNFGAWTNVSNCSVNGCNTVQSTTKYAGTYADQIDFYMCGDSTDIACGAANQDVGPHLEKVLEPQTHFFMRGYVNIHVNPGGTPLNTIGRKLFYFLDPYDTWHAVFSTTIGESATQYRAFTFFIGTKGGTGCELNTISTRSAATCSGLVGSSRTTTQYYWVEDAWYYVEVELKANTPAAAGPYDGEARMWVQRIGVDVSPILVAEATGINYRTALTTGITRVQVGRQVNRFYYNVIDEKRFWDNIAIKTTGPIGP